MFKWSQKNSEHDDIYNRLRLDKQKGQEQSVDQEDGYSDLSDEQGLSRDPYSRFKKGYSLDKDYEIYLEIQKKQHQWKKMWNQDPMEKVADKIRKAEDLDYSDLKLWVTYNFLALPKDDQDRVKQLVERQQKFWRQFTFLTPPMVYGIYAVTKYQLRTRVAPSLLLTLAAVGGIFKLGLLSSNKEMAEYYQQLYNKYKDEVVNPKYRGLKLFNNKKAYQVDNKEFTTSNFDDLKELVKKQLKQ